MPENRLKRPRDPAQLAKLMIDIASGEVEDRAPDSDRNPAAAALGKLGGTARAKKMTAEQRSKAAKKAAKARWSK